MRCPKELIRLSLPKAVRFRAMSMGLAILAMTLLCRPALADDWVISSAQAAVREEVFPIDAAKVTFSIKPQSLESALDTFGAATGVELLYNASLTDGLQSPGVVGQFTPDDALHILLADTNLLFVQTAPKAIKLVANVQTASLSAPPGESVSLMVLGTLHVEAPAMQDFLPYATALRYAIRDALQRESGLRRSSYRAILNVWVTPAGTVQRAQFLKSTGDAVLDGSITKTVQAIALEQSPPADLPQPVHVWILTGKERATLKQFDVSLLNRGQQP